MFRQLDEANAAATERGFQMPDGDVMVLTVVGVVDDFADFDMFSPSSKVLPVTTGSVHISQQSSSIQVGTYRAATIHRHIASLKDL